MTNLRSIFSILALLLSSQGAQLVASQAQTQPSDFCTKQNTVTVLDISQVQQVATMQAVPQATSSSMQSSSSSSAYTGGSTSSTSGATIGSCSSGPKQSAAITAAIQDNNALALADAYATELFSDAETALPILISLVQELSSQYLSLPLTKNQELPSAATVTAQLKAMLKPTQQNADNLINEIFSGLANCVWAESEKESAQKRQTPQENVYQGLKTEFLQIIRTFYVQNVMPAATLITILSEDLSICRRHADLMVVAQENGLPVQTLEELCLQAIKEKNGYQHIDITTSIISTPVTQEEAKIHTAEQNIAQETNVLVSKYTNSTAAQIVADYVGQFKTCITTLAGHQSPLRSLIVLPQGLIVSSDSNGTIKIWNPTTYSCLSSLKTYDNGFLAASANDNFISVSNTCSTIEYWQPTDTTWYCVEGEKNRIYSFAILPNNQFAAGVDNYIKIWSKSSATFFDKSVKEPMDILAVLPNNLLASASSNDTVIMIWNSKTKRLEQSFTEHSSHDSNITALISDKSLGDMLVSGHANGMIKIWNVVTGQCLYKYKENNPICSCVILPENILVAGTEKSITYFNIIVDNNGNPKLKVMGTLPTSGELLATLPDGRIASASKKDTTIKIWA